MSMLVEDCLSLIESTKKISLKITKEVFEELTCLASKDYDINYDKVVEENKAAAKPKNDLSFEEIKNIKLNGQMYFEYNDKVISKRINKSNLILGVLIAIVSVAGLVVSVLGVLVISFYIPINIWSIIGCKNIYTKR